MFIQKTTRKRKSITLAQFVRRRNGVPIGAPKSLQNMLSRSLGAKSFEVFWQYWNPIWGYYLSTKVYSPLTRFVSPVFAVVMTFAISGVLHDLAATLILRRPVFVCTPWFLLLGLGVVVGKKLQMDLSEYAWSIRATTNISYLAACWLVVDGIQRLWLA